MRAGEWWPARGHIAGECGAEVGLVRHRAMNGQLTSSQPNLASFLRVLSLFLKHCYAMDDQSVRDEERLLLCMDCATVCYLNPCSPSGS
jgi:hypothetical protein